MAAEALTKMGDKLGPLASGNYGVMAAVMVGGMVPPDCDCPVYDLLP